MLLKLAIILAPVSVISTPVTNHDSTFHILAFKLTKTKILSQHVIAKLKFKLEINIIIIIIIFICSDKNT